MARSSIVGFRYVDASHDPADLIRYLQAVSEVPFVRERARTRIARSRSAPRPAHDPAHLIRCRQAVSEVPCVRERARTRLARSRIAPGQAVADLGCGLG